MDMPLESEVLLLIADISGYTRFMLTNHTARVHAHGIVADLLAVVAREAAPPLAVNKFDGRGERPARRHRAIPSRIGRNEPEHEPCRRPSYRRAGRRFAATFGSSRAGADSSNLSGWPVNS
jgi:hypothetical protein